MDRQDLASGAGASERLVHRYPRRQLLQWLVRRVEFPSVPLRRLGSLGGAKRKRLPLLHENSTGHWKPARRKTRNRAGSSGWESGVRSHLHGPPRAYGRFRWLERGQVSPEIANDA